MGGETSQKCTRQAHTRLAAYSRPLTLYQSVICSSGYTIVNSLILFNGTLYIVTDQQERWPPLDSISAVIPSEEDQYKNDLQFVSLEQAVELIPPLAGR